MRVDSVSLPMVAAGAAYFGLIFTAGFLLGTLRTFVVAPRVGELTAVLAEVPIILLAAWFACGWALRKFDVAPRAVDRIAMGAIALGLLLVGEAAVSVALAGSSLNEHFRSYSQPGPLIGFVAQLVYASFPLIRGGTSPERRSA